MATKKTAADEQIDGIRIRVGSFVSPNLKLSWDPGTNDFELHEFANETTIVLSPNEVQELYEILKAKFGDRELDA